MVLVEEVADGRNGISGNVLTLAMLGEATPTRHRRALTAPPSFSSAP